MKLIDGITVSYRQEISGGYYVSVSTGFYSVDTCKFLNPHSQAMCRGLAV